MEVILKYLEFIPAYAADLIALLTAPKTFLKSVNVATDTNWSRALRFFVFSAVASFLLIRLSGLPYQAKDENFLVGLSKSVVLWAVGVLFGAAAIKISWKLTGGKASFDSILLTHMYVVSVSLLSINCITLAESGLVGRSNFYSGLLEIWGQSASLNHSADPFQQTLR